jgi:aldose 1-epimerase
MASMKLYTIENQSGIKVKLTNYGGRVVSLQVPDKEGKLDDIVLGYDNLYSYITSNEKYYGAIIGRYGNRIENAKFQIEGKEYQLGKNDGKNSLHGGLKGFHNVFWDIVHHEKQLIEFAYLSKDMEEGFPGNLKVSVTYHLTDDNELQIEYHAITDKTTIVNLTHHSFFNLNNDKTQSINNHILQIFADYYTPVNSELIPTGDIVSVENTPFDFRIGRPIGSRLFEQENQLLFGHGYDHNWVLNKKGQGKNPQIAAIVTDPVSGRSMEVLTNEPGIQFYGGNFLNGKDIGKKSIGYKHRTAFCLETQHFPDSPNKKNFPSTILNKGENYYSICIYKFHN